MAATHGGRPTPQPLPFELKFHHCGISVPDLEASIAWYGEMLGFEVEQRMSLDFIPAKIALLRRGDLRLELFEVPNSVPAAEDRRDPDRDVRTHGTKHVAFAVQDLPALADEFRRRGVDIVFVKEPCIYIRDNCGTLIEFVRQPEP